MLVAGASAVAVWREGRALVRRGPEAVARPVAVGAVLVGAVLDVLQLRLRGATPAGAETDPQLALVSVLLGLAAAVVLRAYPVLLRLVTRWARRGHGTVGLVGLAQAGRCSGAAATADGADGVAGAGVRAGLRGVRRAGVGHRPGGSGGGRAVADRR
ncbi:hypothetical protein [Kitasatospora phosalacinea]|uniref:hypothetical protein n=1 Tax=Kitasatospora phosalacinea TaxID=2065 RepID=UPI000A54CB34|nr:hypothetical protein [Kitasatospora phosalacinea]